MRKLKILFLHRPTLRTAPVTYERASQRLNQGSNLTQLTNIDGIVNNEKKLIFLQFLANKIRKPILIDRKNRIFIVGIYSSTFLQKIVNKFLSIHSYKLCF